MAQGDETNLDDDKDKSKVEPGEEPADEKDKPKSDPDEDKADDKSKSSDDDAGSDDDDDKSSDDDKDKSKLERRFSGRFKGETLEEYTDNLEEGYANSSAEAMRWKREAEQWKEKAMTAVAGGADDDDDKGDDKDKGGDDKKTKPVDNQNPALDYAESRMREEMVADYKDFVEKYPQIEKDEALFKEFDEETGYAMAHLRRKTGSVPTLREAMERAASVMGLKPDSELTDEEKTAMAAKDAGSGSKSKGTPKDKPKLQFSEKQIATARKMDPSLKDKTDAQVAEVLAKYANK